MALRASLPVLIAIMLPMRLQYLGGIDTTLVEKA
jgi:hypothetical protein